VQHEVQALGVALDDGHVDEEALTVRGHVEVRGAARHIEQRAGGAHLELGPWLYIDRHEPFVRRTVEDLLSVGSPLRPGAASVGDLDLSFSVRK